MFYQKILKNLLDLVVSAVLLVIVLPLLAVLSILLAFSFKGNPFFIQKRIGKEEVWWRHGKGKCNEQEDASS